jgi:hypothetical protein
MTFPSLSVQRKTPIRTRPSVISILKFLFSQPYSFCFPGVAGLDVVFYEMKHEKDKSRCVLKKSLITGEKKLVFKSKLFFSIWLRDLLYWLHTRLMETASAASCLPETVGYIAWSRKEWHDIWWSVITLNLLLRHNSALNYSKRISQ